MVQFEQPGYATGSRPGGFSGFGDRGSSSGSPRDGFGTSRGGSNPFTGFPPGAGFSHTWSSTKATGQDQMSPEEFMRWYRTTFADAFRDLDEVLRRGGARASSNPFGRGSDRGTLNYSLVRILNGSPSPEGFDAEAFVDPLEAMASAFGFRTQNERRNIGYSNITLPTQFDIMEASNETVRSVAQHPAK